MVSAHRPGQDPGNANVEDKSALLPVTDTERAKNKLFWEKYKVKPSAAASSASASASAPPPPPRLPEEDVGEGGESESGGETSDAGESTMSGHDSDVAHERYMAEGDHGIAKLETQDLEMACACLDMPSPKAPLEDDVEGGPSSSASEEDGSSAAGSKEVATSQATTLVMGDVPDQESAGFQVPPKPDWLVLQQRLDRPLEELTPSDGTDDAVQADAEDGPSLLSDQNASALYRR